MAMIDEAEIRRTISTMKPDRELFEIRIIDGKWNVSGYFTDADTLIRELRRIRMRPNANIYITLNAIKQECYSRKQRDVLIEGATPTTNDNDIQGLEWLMIDIDPKRAAGTSSSNEQIEKAKSKAGIIYTYLKHRGWQLPIVAMSGNGIHLLYAVGLLNNKENVQIMQNALLALDLLFSDGESDIDLKTFNPARVCKLYGTKAQKGSDTPDRPHRMSCIISVPEQIRQNDKELLLSLADCLPKEEPPQKYNSYNPRSFNVEEWMTKHGLKVAQKTDWNGGTKWILEECPFDSSHKGKDASVIQTADGKLCFNCFHNSCADKKWRELRMLYEPEAYERKNQYESRYPNYQNPNYQAVKVQEQKTVDGKPVFYTTEQIRLMESPPEEYIKTGIHVIDRKMRGLKKGFVTCLSGLRACGKSSIISQVAIETVQQGYKVAMFSGELTAKNTLNWLLLQSAGRNYVLSTQYENYYKVRDSVSEKISKWLDEKIYIYNNDYGNNFDEVIAHLNHCVVEHKVDLVILDNLMSININMLDRDKYQQQSLFVEQLENFAKNSNIHIIFVAHPRKSEGFLRLDDVSGSNDIVNRVDNALILHRVNNDFKRLSQQMFKWPESHELYQCSNVIEICKDRDGGVQDEFIPLYFEQESKRLRNTPSEYKNYGWLDVVDPAEYDSLPF